MTSLHLQRSVFRAATMAAKFSRTKNVRVDASSGTIAYTGGSSVGGAISSQAFSRRAPYFEFKIVDRGSSCAIGVGASPSDYSLDKMPGKAPHAPVVVPTPLPTSAASLIDVAFPRVPHQHHPNDPSGWKPKSVGFHADDGKLYTGTGSGRVAGSVSTTGDIMGCGIDFKSNRVYFTRNGAVVETVPMPDGATTL